MLAHDGNVSTSEQLISVLVESLLYPDVGVRSAAAGVAFNIGLWRHHNVVEETPNVDWELEVVSGLVEALDREEDEDVGELHYLDYNMRSITNVCEQLIVFLQPLLWRSTFLQAMKITFSRCCRSWKHPIRLRRDVRFGRGKRLRRWEKRSLESFAKPLPNRRCL